MATYTNQDSLSTGAQGMPSMKLQGARRNASDRTDVQSVSCASVNTLRQTSQKVKSSAAHPTGPSTFWCRVPRTVKTKFPSCLGGGFWQVQRRGSTAPTVAALRHVCPRQVIQSLRTAFISLTYEDFFRRIGCQSCTFMYVCPVRQDGNTRNVIHVKS